MDVREDLHDLKYETRVIGEYWNVASDQGPNRERWVVGELWMVASDLGPNHEG